MLQFERWNFGDLHHFCLNVHIELTRTDQNPDWKRSTVSGQLTQDEQKLLGSTQSEDGDQTATLPVHNVVDGVTETSLPLLSLLVDVSPVGGLLTRRRMEKSI